MSMKRRVFIIALFFLILSHSFTQTNNRARKWIDEAKQYIGTPYLYGGMSKNGIDCSGFIHITALNSIQISLPRTTEALYDWVKNNPRCTKRGWRSRFFQNSRLKYFPRRFIYGK